MGEITEKQLNIIRHALGIEYGGEPYRNYYYTAPGSKGYEECRKLEEEGFMAGTEDSLDITPERYIFKVTKSGIEALKDKGEGL